MGKRHYKVILTTTGPVHIGNGGTYGKKDYFKVDNKRLGILDVSRFVATLKADDLEEYCRFLQTDSQTRFQDFLDEHPGLMPSARKCVAYKVETTLAKAPRGSLQHLAVFQFVKDPYGQPYVPGSSVKGMLRTALLSYLVQRDRDSYAKLYDSEKAQDKDQCARACKDIERKAFWRERPNKDDSSVKNDIMRYVSVSDSNPLTTDDLVFAKKYDKFARSDSGRHKLAMGKISKDPAYRQGNDLNIYRECLRPGVRVELRLDVDSRIDAYLDGLVLDREGIATVLDASFKLYEQCFLKRFDLEGIAGAATGGADASDSTCRYVYQSGVFTGRRCRNRAVGDTGYCNIHKSYAVSAGKQLACCLGGGVDFNSKTVLNALFEDDPARVYEISRVLYAQFPTKFDRTLHRELEDEVRSAGFEPKDMRAEYRQGRLSKGKDDHRHWKDAELGVSPHTLKLGIIGSQKYLMGRCSLAMDPLDMEEDK